jgi:hypothetical protein
MRDEEFREEGTCERWLGNPLESSAQDSLVSIACPSQGLASLSSLRGSLHARNISRTVITPLHYHATAGRAAILHSNNLQLLEIYARTFKALGVLDILRDWLMGCPTVISLEGSHVEMICTSQARERLGSIPVCTCMRTASGTKCEEGGMRHLIATLQEKKGIRSQVCPLY